MATNYVSNNNMTSLMQAIKQAIQNVIYTLPTASANTKGGIKVDDEALQVVGEKLFVNAATANTRGAIRIGDYLVETGTAGEGKISVDRNAVLGTIPTTLETMQTAINGKASQADLTALTTRVGTAETNISGLQGRMTTAESNISTNTYNIQAINTNVGTITSKSMSITNSNTSIGTFSRISAAKCGPLFLWKARFSVNSPQNLNGAQIGSIDSSMFCPYLGPVVFPTSNPYLFLKIAVNGAITALCTDIYQVSGNIDVYGQYMVSI